MAELFRSKIGKHPIEVNKVRPETVQAVALWCGGVAVIEHDALRHDVTYAAINVPTPSGMKRAQEDDWVIRLPTGEFYPVTQARFDELLEAVPPDGKL